MLPKKGPANLYNTVQVKGAFAFFPISIVSSFSIGGSVVEFSPATREARVRFPANASHFSLPYLPTCCVSIQGLHPLEPAPSNAAFFPLFLEDALL